MRSYRCLSVQELIIGDYKICPIDDSNIESIMHWRNSQLDVLRQTELLTLEKQIGYFEKHIWPTFIEKEPKQILFGLYYQNEFIGYGGLVHIAWIDKRAEISFLVNPGRLDNATYKLDMSNYLSLIKEIAFTVLGFNRLYTETYDIRPLHISILESLGFILEGRMKEHVIINGKCVDSLIHGCLKSTYSK